MVRFVEVISSIIGFALIVYSYLVAKRKKLNITFVSEEELEGIDLKEELGRDIAVPILVKGIIFLTFGILFAKFKILSVLLLGFITLCVYALENKIARSLFRYKKQKNKKRKLNNK